MNRILPQYKDKEIQIQILGDWTYILSRKDLLKQNSYRWNPTVKVWFKRSNFIQIEDLKNFVKKEFYLLQKIFPVTELDMEMFKFSIRTEFGLIDKTKPIENNELLNFDINKLPENLQKSLMEHQKLGIERFIKQDKKLLLAWEMGVGKTLGSLSIAKYFNKSLKKLVYFL